MAWTVYGGGGSNHLARGQASLMRSGVLRLHTSDAAAAGIACDAHADCVVETDREAMRLSVRAPSAGEPTLTLWREKGRRCRVSIAGALRQIGFERPERPTRVRVEIVPGRLVVLLTPQAKTPPPAPPAEKAPAGRFQKIGRARPLKEIS